MRATPGIILSWDTALSAKELASYSVCVILQIRGETVDVGGLRFSVMLARGGAVRWFRVARMSGPPSDAA